MLSHEEVKFKFEQNMALKKEVFLEVASSFSKVLGIFPRLIDLEIKMDQIREEVNDNGPAASKAYLVAKEDTVSKLMEFSSDVMETFLSLVKPRAVLLDHKSAIDIYRGMISNSEAEQERLLSIMKEINLQGIKDKRKFDYLQECYENEKGRIEDARAGLDHQKNELGTLHKDFATKCISEYGRLCASVVPMTIAIRDELDNDEASSLLIDAMNKSVGRMEAAFEKLFE